MTTVSSSRGPTEVINARRTESSDAPEIHNLIQSHTLSQFGYVNVVHLIEKSNLSVTLNNEENEILGFAGFLDHPPNDVCDPAEWESWMKEMKYKSIKKATPLNSLFMHFFVAKNEYTIGCSSEIVRTVFNAVPELRFIFICLRNEARLEQALDQIFIPLEKEVSMGHHTLYACCRHDHVPQLHIRKAVVEDHDDVIPIFKRLNNNLTQVYGDYFLAEMVEAQDENNHCLVAEAGGKAVGFISVCTEVNVELIQKSYEADSFHGFCKPHPDDVLREVESEPEVAGSSDNSESDSDPVQEKATDEELTFLPDVEAVEKPASQDEIIVTSASVESAANRVITPLQSPSSNVTEAAETTIVVPKLSELHMGSSFDTVTGSDTFDDADICITAPPSAVPPKSSFSPTYCGASNVFSIQLFCISEQYEMRSVDFLPEIFKLFPDKDIAIMTIPHLVPEFPLLQQFVRVTPRPGVNVPHELYCFHRHGLLSSSFRIRRACSSDYKQIEALIENIHMRENLLSDLNLFNQARRDEDGTNIQAFVADCMDQVVGVCIVRNEEDIEFIRARYNIEDFIYFNHHRRDEHGHLHHFALNPIFQHYAKHFLKEVLRQAHKSCLYYTVYPEETEHTVVKKQSLITSLNFLVPVRARRQISYPLAELGINAPSERIIAKTQPYALTHINRKLTLEPKVTINARIVVVGASDVGVSILENFCFCPHLRFNNLTLISKRGLPRLLHSTAHVYDDHEMAEMSLRSWVNVVTGVMVGIDRSRQEVVMEDGSTLSYDHLLLCTGQQFQVPAPTEADLFASTAAQDLNKSAVIRPLDQQEKVPENVIALNDAIDYEVVQVWASKLAGKMSGKEENSPGIVVYGRSIEAFATIQQLLSLGVPGERLIFVKPPSYTTSLSVCDDGCEGDPFNEPIINETVTKMLSDNHVTVYEDHVLASWHLENADKGIKVTTLTFSSLITPLVNIPCIGLLCLHPRRIDHRTFMAANNSCLVFDGRLSIDADFKTNDPRIRAAGPLTKYMRRYYADGVDFRHENFSSREVGFRLAMKILPLFDPTLDGNVEMSNNMPPTPGPASKRATPAVPASEENPHEKLVPAYVEPKVAYVHLPGGYEYLHVRKPGKRVKFHVQISDGDHGYEMFTGSIEKGNYFRLHVNQYRCVETITCLVRPDIVHLPVSDFVRLYGVHERYLNNLLSRYDEGLVSDFFVFFREPWAISLFHDRFQDFRQEIRDLLCSAPEGAKNVLSVNAMVRQLVEEDMAISDEQRQALVQHYNHTGRRTEVEGRLLSYLGYNYYHLPMYAKPGMV